MLLCLQCTYNLLKNTLVVYFEGPCVQIGKNINKAYLVYLVLKTIMQDVIMTNVILNMVHVSCVL